jgi:hypothetical protein
MRPVNGAFVAIQFMALPLGCVASLSSGEAFEFYRGRWDYGFATPMRGKSQISAWQSHHPRNLA